MGPARADAAGARPTALPSQHRHPHLRMCRVRRPCSCPFARLLRIASLRLRPAVPGLSLPSPIVVDRSTSPSRSPILSPLSPCPCHRLIVRACDWLPRVWRTGDDGHRCPRHQATAEDGVDHQRRFDVVVFCLKSMYSLRPKKKSRYEKRAGQTFLTLTRFIENVCNIYISK